MLLGCFHVFYSSIQPENTTFISIYDQRFFSLAFRLWDLTIERIMAPETEQTTSKSTSMENIFLFSYKYRVQKRMFFTVGESGKSTKIIRPAPMHSVPPRSGPGAFFRADRPGLFAVFKYLVCRPVQRWVPTTVSREVGNLITNIPVPHNSSIRFAKSHQEHSQFQNCVE